MLRDAPLTAKTFPETYEWMRSVNDNITDLATDLSTVSDTVSGLSDTVADLSDTVADLSDRVTALEAIEDFVLRTPEGGIAVKFKNRTGGASVKGYVVKVSPDYDNAVSLILIDDPSPIGVIYESGVSDGEDVWVVTSGKAEVYYTGSTNRGNISRGFLTVDAGYVSGQAYNEVYPGAFTSDEHFYEIGHVLENRTGAGLALTLLHFN